MEDNEDFVPPGVRQSSMKQSTVHPEQQDGSRKIHGSVRQAGGVVFPEGDVKLNSSFSLNKVQSVFSSFVGEKRELIESIGFSGLMSMHKQVQISRRLAFWLLSNFDVVTSSIAVRQGVKLKIADSDVQLVLGLPGNGVGLIGPKLSASRAYDVVKGILGLRKTSEISIDYVELLLTKDYGGRMSSKEKDAFKVAAVLFADAHLFAPRTGPSKVNQDIMSYLVDPSCIQKVNWCHHVLSVVQQSSMRVKHCLATGKKSVSLDCCLIFLEVFYLDNLDIGILNPSYMCLPRVSDHPYDKMKNIISLDKGTSKDGKYIMYGKLKVVKNGCVI